MVQVILSPAATGDSGGVGLLSACLLQPSHAQTHQHCLSNDEVSTRPNALQAVEVGHYVCGYTCVPV